MGKPTQIVRTPPAHQAKVFHQVNPSEIFSDLEEIGHGSFGSVYKVRAPDATLRVGASRVFVFSLFDMRNRCTFLIATRLFLHSTGNKGRE